MISLTEIGAVGLRASRSKRVVPVNTSIPSMRDRGAGPPRLRSDQGWRWSHLQSIPSQRRTLGFSLEFTNAAVVARRASGKAFGPGPESTGKGAHTQISAAVMCGSTLAVSIR